MSAGLVRLEKNATNVVIGTSSAQQHLKMIQGSVQADALRLLPQSFS